MSDQPEVSRIRRRAVTGTAHAGQRLDRVAAELFPDFSRSRLASWIRRGELTVGGIQSSPSHRLGGGEWLVLDALPEAEGAPAAQAIDLDIVHEDEALLVVNKPAGLVVHPAAGNPDGTLQNAILHHAPDLAVVPRSGLVHRLDKDTSGVMVVAKTLAAHHSLVDQLQRRTMSRRYQALVRGEPPSAGTIEGNIGRHPRQRKKMAVVSGGKPAVTHYRVLRRLKGFAHLGLTLESGRTHQIRVHLQHLGFPILGDPLYNRRRLLPNTFPDAVRQAVREFPRQALHAWRLQLSHPSSGDVLSFEAPLPQDILGLLHILKHETAEVTE